MLKPLPFIARSIFRRNRLLVFSPKFNLSTLTTDPASIQQPVFGNAIVEETHDSDFFQAQSSAQERSSELDQVVAQALNDVQACISTIAQCTDPETRDLLACSALRRIAAGDVGMAIQFLKDLQRREVGDDAPDQDLDFGRFGSRTLSALLDLLHRQGLHNETVRLFGFIADNHPSQFFPLRSVRAYLDSALTIGDLDALGKVLELVEADRFVPTAGIFHVILRGFLSLSYSGSVQTVFAMMEQKGLRPNSATGALLLEMVRSPDQLTASLEFLRAAGVPIDIPMQLHLVQCQVRLGMLDEAHKKISALTAKGHVLNPVVMNFALAEYAKADRLDLATQHIQLVSRSKARATPKALSQVLMCAGRTGSVSKVYIVFSQIVQACRSRDPFVLQAATMALFNAYDVASNSGKPLDEQAFCSTLLSVLSRSRDFKTASSEPDFTPCVVEIILSTCSRRLWKCFHESIALLRTQNCLIFTKDSGESCIKHLTSLEDFCAPNVSAVLSNSAIKPVDRILKSVNLISSGKS